MQPLGTDHGTNHELSQYDQVHIVGVQAQGFHGVLAAERSAGQTFTVDATLFLETGQAAIADDLNLTVNYAHVAEAIVSVIEGAPVNLIETLAERLAAVVMEQDLVYGVGITVHKPQAPIAVPFQDVTVRIVRTRANPPTVSRPFTESLIAPVADLPGWQDPDPTLTQTTVIPVVPALSPDVALLAPIAVPAQTVEPTPEPEVEPEPVEETPVEEASEPSEPLAPSEPEAPVEFVDFVAPVLTTGDLEPDEPQWAELNEEAPDTAEVAGPSGNDDETQLIPIIPKDLPALDLNPKQPQIIEPSPESLAIYQALRAEVLGVDSAVAQEAEETAIPSTPAEPAGDLMDTVPSAPARVVLALGANLGDAQGTLAAAVGDLGQIEGFEVTKTGPLARTGAVGGPEDQPDYLNTVIIGYTTLSPRALLEQTQAIENKHGRVRTEHWGPRTLDVDIIDYAGVIGTTTDLELPHPRANQRAFVLVPWEVMEPEDHLPGLGGGPVAALAATARDRDTIRWVALEWLEH